MKRLRKTSTNIFCESYLKDRFTFWTLKIILELGGKNDFVDKDNYCRRDELATFLNLKEHFDNDNTTLKETMSILERLYQSLQSKKLQSHPTLQENIEYFGKTLKLSLDEKRVLEFVLLLNNYNILEEATDLLSNNLNTSQAIDEIAKDIKLFLEKGHKLV